MEVKKKKFPIDISNRKQDVIEHIIKEIKFKFGLQDNDQVCVKLNDAELMKPEQVNNINAETLLKLVKL